MNLKLSFKNCARCGEEHRDLEAKPFTNPPEFEGIDMDYFCICPVTQEPILVCRESKRENNGSEQKKESNT